MNNQVTKSMLLEAVRNVMSAKSEGEGRHWGKVARVYAWQLGQTGYSQPRLTSLYPFHFEGDKLVFGESFVYRKGDAPVSVYNVVAPRIKPYKPIVNEKDRKAHAIVLRLPEYRLHAPISIN